MVSEPSRPYEGEKQAPTKPGGIPAGNGRAYLGRFYDPALELPDYLDRRVITERELDRIQRAFSIVWITSQIPRRLGGDAGRDELALDKKRAKRVMHALVQSYKGWQTREPKRLESEEIRIAGANLQWEAFGPAHHTSVLARMRLVATYAIKADDHKWGRSAVTRLENEIRWVSYALRD